jgi:hypothetical protein
MPQHAGLRLSADDLPELVCDNLIGDLLTSVEITHRGALSESDVTTKREFNFAHGFLRNVARGQLREVRLRTSFLALMTSKDRCAIQPPFPIL